MFAAPTRTAARLHQHVARVGIRPRRVPVQSAQSSAGWNDESTRAFTDAEEEPDISTGRSKIPVLQRLRDAASAIFKWAWLAVLLGAVACLRMMSGAAATDCGSRANLSQARHMQQAPYASISISDHNSQQTMSKVLVYRLQKVRRHPFVLPGPGPGVNHCDSKHRRTSCMCNTVLQIYMQ